MISQTGRVISLSEFPAAVQPPLTVYAPPNFNLSEGDVSRWATWLEFVGAQTGVAVDFVDARKPLDLSIGCQDLVLRVGAPDSGLTRRLARLTSIMPAVAQYRNRLEYIDLSLDNSIPLKVHKESKVKADAAEPADGGQWPLATVESKRRRVSL